MPKKNTVSTKVAKFIKRIEDLKRQVTARTQFLKTDFITARGLDFAGFAHGRIDKRNLLSTLSVIHIFGLPRDLESSGIGNLSNDELFNIIKALKTSREVFRNYINVARRTATRLGSINFDELPDDVASDFRESFDSLSDDVLDSMEYNIGLAIFTIFGYNNSPQKILDLSDYSFKKILKLLLLNPIIGVVEFEHIPLFFLSQALNNSTKGSSERKRIIRLIKEVWDEIKSRAKPEDPFCETTFNYIAYQLPITIDEMCAIDKVSREQYLAFSGLRHLYQNIFTQMLNVADTGATFTIHNFKQLRLPLFIKPKQEYKLASKLVCINGFIDRQAANVKAILNRIKHDSRLNSLIFKAIPLSLYLTETQFALTSENLSAVPGLVANNPERFKQNYASFMRNVEITIRENNRWLEQIAELGYEGEEISNFIAIKKLEVQRVKSLATVIKTIYDNPRVQEYIAKRVAATRSPIADVVHTASVADPRVKLRKALDDTTVDARISMLPQVLTALIGRIRGHVLLDAGVIKEINIYLNAKFETDEQNENVKRKFKAFIRTGLIAIQAYKKECSKYFEGTLVTADNIVNAALKTHVLAEKLKEAVITFLAIPEITENEEVRDFLLGKLQEFVIKPIRNIENRLLQKSDEMYREIEGRAAVVIRRSHTHGGGGGGGGGGGSGGGTTLPTKRDTVVTELFSAEFDMGQLDLSKSQIEFLDRVLNDRIDFAPNKLNELLEKLGFQIKESSPNHYHAMGNRFEKEPTLVLRYAKMHSPGSASKVEQRPIKSRVRKFLVDIGCQRVVAHFRSLSVEGEAEAAEESSKLRP